MIGRRVADAIGSIRAELYNNKVTVYNYTAFGEVLNTGPTTVSGTSNKTGLGFTGHYADSESGLYYARARYYDPSAGRFMSRDPAVDYTPSGLNKYIYCDNNPVNYIDPTGETFIIDDIIAASIGAVNGVFRALGQGGNAWDVLLGGLSGALSGWANLYTFMGGVTVDFFVTTKSVTVGGGLIGVANGSLTYSGANGGTFNASANVGFQIGSYLKVGGEVGVTFNNFNSKGFGTNDINTNIGLNASVNISGFYAGASVGASWNTQGGFQGFNASASTGFGIYGGFGLEFGVNAGWNNQGEMTSAGANSASVITMRMTI